MSSRFFPAEWYPQSAVVLTFPHADSDWAPYLDWVTPVFVNIATQIAMFEKVVIICDDVQRVEAFVSHIPKEKRILIPLPSNDTWARDHHAITVMEDGKPVLVDFIFNGWGLKFSADKDNLLTGKMWQQGYFGDVRREIPGLAIEGGALESDGKGTLLTTSECMLSPNRNPHLSKEELTQKLCEVLGVNRVLWLDHGYLAGDDTDSHIDTLARFCDSDTIAYVRCEDEADEHYEALKKMEAQLQTFTKEDGSPYRLVSLPMAKAVHDEDGHRLPATYANFLIINDAVLVPTYDDPQLDSVAIDTLQRVFSDRKVIGIPCLPLIYQHGSLHCVTMQFPEGIF